MKTINVSFINFWHNFDSKSWFKYWQKLFYHPNITWENTAYKNIDLLVSSVFSSSIDNVINFNGKKILYTRENLNFHQYHLYKNNLNQFNLVIGFEDKHNQVNIPFYYRTIIEYDINVFNYISNFDLERKPFCLINSNPQQLRLSLIQSFKQKNLIVDCPGLVGNNIKVIIPYGFYNKLEFIKDYYFNICPENSYCTGYTTEKIFDCCMAGCIPIYYGCSNLNDGFYNKNRILHIKQDLSNYNQIVDQAIHLLNNKSELISFMNQKPFVSHIDLHITAIKNKINTILETLL